MPLVRRSQWAPPGRSERRRVCEVEHVGTYASKYASKYVSKYASRYASKYVSKTSE